MNQRLDFFDLPRGRKMQQYEALRAYHYEQCSVEEAAARGGYTPGSFRNLLTRFKKQPEFEFFWPSPTPSAPTPKPDNPRVARILELRRQGSTITEIQTILNQEGLGASVGYIQNIFTQAGIQRLPPRRTRPQFPRTIADRRQLDRSPRTFRTDFAGLFLFAFDLVRMNLDEILNEVQMPGTRMIPALSGVLSLLALKLSGIGRPSQVMAETLDQGLALFTGLNVIPKKSTLTEYSIKVNPAFAAPLMHRWYHAATNIAEIIGGGQSIDLDFHTIPYHGDHALLEKHFVSKRSRRQRGILTVLARDASSSVFCYADTTLRKDTQNDAILRFVDDWKARTGDLPGELVFDSRFTTYANLAELTRRGINFITLRRRHAALLKQIYTLEPEAWTKTRLANIGRAYRNPSVAEQTVNLRNYPHELRQLFVKNLGHDKPTVLITNQMERTANQLIDRYARRMIIENVISDAIDFFHMDALSSAVPMRINVDVQLTVMASILYRLMGVRVGEGYETAEARRIYRDLGRQSGKITIGQDEILVQIRSRAKAGYLIAAGYPELRQKIPWLDNKILRVQFSRHT